MQLKSRNEKATRVGSAGGFLATVWGAYSHYTTIAQLPSDAGELSKMLADPPIYLPWVILILCVVLLGWSFWPSEDEGDEVDPIAVKTSGPHSPAIHAGRDVHFHPSPAATQPVKSPYGTAHLRPGEEARHPMIEQIIQNKYLDQDARLEAERRAKFEPPPPAQRDVLLPEALAFATFGEWGKSFYDAVTAGLVPSNEPLMRFRQLAHDGILSAWGKRREGSVFQMIPKEHWLDHNIEWFDLLRGTARTENVTHTTSDPFLDIMVSRAQFEQAWPHAE